MRVVIKYFPLPFMFVQFNFVYIVSVTIKVVSKSFAETQSLASKRAIVEETFSRTKLPWGDPSVDGGPVGEENEGDSRCRGCSFTLQVFSTKSHDDVCITEARKDPILVFILVRE